MKRLALSVAVATLVLTGCGTTGKSTAPITEQKLATSFVGEKIKIETKCSWFGMGKDCEIVALEAVGTAPTFGGTVNNRKRALTAAEMDAKANITRFLEQKITTNTVKTTIAKNIEKASDKVGNGTADGETVAMTDQEAKNVSLRENQNSTVVNLTETIQMQAQTILRGFRKVSEDVVGPQEVSVTIRWDKDSEKSAEYFRNRFAPR
jgi:hypothetical protein